PYLRSAAEETFALEEVEAMRPWFETNCPDGRFEWRPAAPIEENQMGAGAVPGGGLTGSLMFSEEAGFPLSCQVFGRYDLRHAETGRTVTYPGAEGGAG